MEEKAGKTTQKTKYWILYGLLFLIFYLVGQFGLGILGKFFKSEETPKELLEREWTKETYGSLGLIIETPYKLTKNDLPIPDNLKELIEQIDSYKMAEKGFEVMVSSIKYNPAVGQANLEAAINNSTNGMRTQKGVSNFDYTENTFSKKNIPGIIQKGTFNQNEVELEFINVGFSKGLILWQVLVIYRAKDEVGKTISNRIVDSIEIDESKI